MLLFSVLLIIGATDVNPTRAHVYGPYPGQIGASFEDACNAAIDKEFGATWTDSHGTRYYIGAPILCARMPLGFTKEGRRALGARE